MDLQETQKNLVELKDKAMESMSSTLESAKAAAASAAHTVGESTYTQQLLSAVDSAKQTVADSAVTQQLLSAVDSAKQTVANSAVTQQLSSAADSAKHFLSTEASAAAGYKDQLVGAAKEKIGTMTGDQSMTSAGLQQQREGKTTVKNAGVSVDELARDERATVTDTLIKHHALVAEVERTGGADGAELKHVDEPATGDVNLAAIAKDITPIKQFNKEPLLNSIQTGADLKHVETTEKGLLVSIPLGEQDIKGLDTSLKSPRNAVLDEIKQNTNVTANLSEVKDADISDRSEPRLELLKNVAAAADSRNEVVRQIGSGAATTEVALKPTATDDKSQPNLDLPSLNQKPVDKAALLSEVQQGADLKHV